MHPKRRLRMAKTPVYFYFGNLGIFAFDLEGELQWSKSLPARKTRHGWGTAASPVFGMTKDGTLSPHRWHEASWLMALANAQRTIWKIDREPESNWSTPYVWENKLRTELIVPQLIGSFPMIWTGRSFGRLRGCRVLRSGLPMRRMDCFTLALDTWAVAIRGPIYAIRPGASGDISIDETLLLDRMIHSLVRLAGFLLLRPTTLVYDGLLYSLLDRGLLSVMDPKTGAFHFERERLQDARSRVSPHRSLGLQWKSILSQRRRIKAIFNAGKSYELIGVNRLAEDDMGMATPAMTDNKLLIRTSARLYCIVRDE